LFVGFCKNSNNGITSGNGITPELFTNKNTPWLLVCFTILDFVQHYIFQTNSRPPDTNSEVKISQKAYVWNSNFGIYNSPLFSVLLAKSVVKDTIAMYIGYENRYSMFFGSEIASGGLM
jgi:hypothetical protein